jgi:hypothetical protein
LSLYPLDTVQLPRTNPPSRQSDSMALPSTYALHHSLPNRSPNHRPLNLSLADYQPLNFDREAAEDAHQQSLAVPARSTVSSMSGHSQTSFGGNASAETADTSLSTLSHKLKPGDNPHSVNGVWAPPPNMAGLGTGHALTPPGSPEHSSAAQRNQEMLLSPIPQSPRGREPATPPQEFFDRQNPGYFSGPSSPMDSNARGFSAMNSNDDGYTTDPGGPGLLSRANRRRRSLPAVPSDVPTPVSDLVQSKPRLSLNKAGATSMGVRTILYSL